MINIIAEIGINHNGSVEVAKDLINAAKVAGCAYAKFQKRTPDVCVPEEQKSKMRTTPWGEMSYIDYKKKIEFEEKEYSEIKRHCETIGIDWFASVWDIQSVDFMAQYTSIGKIPSALITNHELMRYSRKKFDTLLISTGMSTEEEIEIAVKMGDPDVIFHTNSAYPSKVDEINLNYIKHLRRKYPTKQIGYSGHEFRLGTSVSAVYLGATIIERHITLDRTMWGTDQLSSIEPQGLIKLVKGIRELEIALGSGEKIVTKAEEQIRKKLRGI